MSPVAEPGSTRTFLVFGDLHGRILPAFRLATVWAREFETPVSAILQVGDLGFFPDPTRLDKATRRHAEKDPTELGTLDIVTSNSLADAILDDPDCPDALYFTAGNHEDYEALRAAVNAAGRQPSAVVDAYCRVRCIKDGHVVPLREGPAVGALWGVDGEGTTIRRNLPERAYVKGRSADLLLASPLDVLLTHDSPADAKRVGCGSELISMLIGLAKPRFAFFGHYHGEGCRIDHDLGPTELYHMSGMELGGRDGCAEVGSVGALTWDGDAAAFEYLEEDWLRTFTRHNWKWR